MLGPGQQLAVVKPTVLKLLKPRVIWAGLPLGLPPVHPVAVPQVGPPMMTTLTKLLHSLALTTTMPSRTPPMLILLPPYPLVNVAMVQEKTLEVSPIKRHGATTALRILSL